MVFLTNRLSRVRSVRCLRSSRSRADSAEGRRPSTGPEKRSAPRAGQRLRGVVASRWRPPARSLRDRNRLSSGANELRVLGGRVFMTELFLCCNTAGLSSRVGGWGGRKRVSFPASSACRRHAGGGPSAGDKHPSHRGKNDEEQRGR